jgi:hypothetical protein
LFFFGETHMQTKKPMLWTLGLILSAIIAGPVNHAAASHIFSTNITIDGTPVAAGGMFTDPTIMAMVGVPVTFSFDVFGDADTFNVTFANVGPSTLPTPASFSVAYAGGATQMSPLTISFTRTFLAAGVFDGTLTPDFPSSFPDYIYPNGVPASEPVIPFAIQVSQANGVPEPGTLTLMGLGAIGLACSRLRRRRELQL